MASSSEAATAPAACSSSARRGTFVVLEGLDRSGKSTQVKLLEERFVSEGRPVKVMRFPGQSLPLRSRARRRSASRRDPCSHGRPRAADRTTPIGQMIDSYLRSAVKMDDHVIHLLFSANRWEAAADIHALLASGTSVVCDRFYHSGIVYSAAKQNPSLSLSWARAPEQGLPRPDAVLFLDLDEQTAKTRGGWGGEVYEKAEMQKRVKELFWELSMGGTDRHRGPLAQTLEDTSDRGTKRLWRQEEEDLIVIDAAAGVEDVAAQIWAHVRARVKQVDDGEVGRSVRIVE
ncbi:Thymidylate kinase [Drechmeria coniospora]|uniref:dTMP kinase n=1 Tax=Drechmeria coniospora TaxID=98403 RepID=A0A151GUZ6_DRECN|nr:Thymidylate kinase [Drechmeria coniospora]KYK60852.1 Thymidylate kinase [Drechmeria coniospora]ODA83547.1 hypothetical protein RJ55_02061 [Drechmeria coniospora]